MQSGFLVMTAFLAGLAGAPEVASWRRDSSGGAAGVQTATPSDSLVVELRIHRLSAASPSSLVSSGIPFKMGALHNEDLPKLRVEVDGNEVPVYVEPLARWRDGSLRSVLVQFAVPETPTANVRLRVGSSPAMARRQGQSRDGLPVAVALPRRVDYLVGTSLMGATIPQAITPTLGIAFTRYEVEFKRLAEEHWKARGDAWEDNYYDRSLIYYVAWMRSGNPEYWNRATRIALSYRREYLENNSYKSSPHWAQLGGLELHYLLTGDTLSRQAVAGVFAWGLSTFAKARPGSNPALNNLESEYMENRIQARVLQGALASYRLNASYTRSDGGAFPATQWPATLRDLLNKILSSQEQDGSWRWAQICYGQLNFMVGLLNDVLVEYYRDFEADPRIPTAIERANEYMWSTQWLSADQAFKYSSVRCSPNKWGVGIGGPTPTGDLNGLIVASFGWLYQHTGDAKWRQRGDAIFAGMFAPRWLTNYSGSKQFNQAYTSSYRYLGYRAPRR